MRPCQHLILGLDKNCKTNLVRIYACSTQIRNCDLPIKKQRSVSISYVTVYINTNSGLTSSIKKNLSRAIDDCS
jgi:hypothetical protein